MLLSLLVLSALGTQTLGYRIKGVTNCGGMTCPLGSGCSVQFSSSEVVQTSTRRCTYKNDTVSWEETAISSKASQDGGRSNGTKTCTIKHTVTNGVKNTTKQCTDSNGNTRPMTAEEEEEFRKLMAENEATGRRIEQQEQEIAMKIKENARKLEPIIEDMEKMQKLTMMRYWNF